MQDNIVHIEMCVLSVPEESLRRLRPLTEVSGERVLCQVGDAFPYSRNTSLSGGDEKSCDRAVSSTA